MSAKSFVARASPIAASAITSSHVSAPVTQGFVLTQRMPSPSTTKVSQSEAIIASAAGPRTAPPSTG